MYTTLLLHVLRTFFTSIRKCKNDFNPSIDYPVTHQFIYLTTYPPTHPCKQAFNHLFILIIKYPYFSSLCLDRLSNYDLGDVIGYGSFGQVVAATRKKDNIPVREENELRNLLLGQWSLGLSHSCEFPIEVPASAEIDQPGIFIILSSQTH